MSRPKTALGECVIFDTWEISRLVFRAHLESFGFTCRFAPTFEAVCESSSPAVLVLSELDETQMEMRSRLENIQTRFKIAVCRLRSPNEIRREEGIDAIVSRHIKRESLRNIVHQLFEGRMVIENTNLIHQPCLFSLRLC